MKHVHLLIPKTATTYRRRTLVARTPRPRRWQTHCKTEHRPLSDFMGGPEVQFHAFVRDPLERLVSHFHYFRRQMNRSNAVNKWWQEVVVNRFQTADEFFAWVDLEVFSAIQVHLVPQAAFVEPRTDRQAESVVSLYDFAHFEQEYQRLLETTGQSRRQRPYPGSAKHAGSSELSTSVTKLRKFYAADFDLYRMASAAWTGPASQLQQS